MKLDSKGFDKAYKLISSKLKPTPLIKNQWLSQKYDCEIYLKLENLQPVGSFKLRGAFNKVSSLAEEERKRGVIASSLGNHAQGVAYAAREFGVPATIIMPKGSPLVKVMNTRSLGAKVIIEGDTVDEGAEIAQRYVEKDNLIFIHPFHDQQVIYGQGTMGLEILSQLDQIDFIFGALGGGGMVCGIGHTVKKLSPDTQVVAVGSSGASALVDSIKAKKLVEGNFAQTFCDGIRVKNARKDMVDLLIPVIDECLKINDNRVSMAILDLMEQARVIAEGAGAISLAAFDLLYKKDPQRFKGKKIVLIVCGGNIDINLIDKIIDRGLVESHRRDHIQVVLGDRPGELFELIDIIKGHEANILDVIHERTHPRIALHETFVEVLVETTGPDHAREIKESCGERFLLLN